jgi:hypothetical protein
MTEPAKVFEDRATPGQWRVEWIGDDGRGELRIFTGAAGGVAVRDAELHAFQRSAARAVFGPIIVLQHGGLGKLTFI